MDQITKNISKKEVTCSCGCGGVPKISFLEDVQRLRDILGFPIVFNSGFRCEKHNAAIGGAKLSMHCKGIAADIRWHKDGEQKHNMLLEALKIFNGVGISEDFLHIDSRAVRCIWTY